MIIMLSYPTLAPKRYVFILFEAKQNLNFECRRIQALKAGFFKDEIIPVEIRGQSIVHDDTVRPGVTAESLTSLKPVFPELGDSSTTAGNASGIGDGAALCILTTREKAEEEGMEVLGKWVASTVVGEQLPVSNS